MQEIIIIMENFNAKVGKERDGEIFGKFRLGTHNECRGKLVQWCTVNDHVLVSPGFKNTQDEYEHGDVEEEKQKTRLIILTKDSGMRFYTSKLLLKCC